MTYIEEDELFKLETLPDPRFERAVMQSIGDEASKEMLIEQCRKVTPELVAGPSKSESGPAAPELEPREAEPTKKKSTQDNGQESGSESQITECMYLQEEQLSHLQCRPAYMYIYGK